MTWNSVTHMLTSLHQPAEGSRYRAKYSVSIANSNGLRVRGETPFRGVLSELLESSTLMALDAPSGLKAGSV
jgi:hypothetical protein